MITSWQHVRPGALVLLKGKPYRVTDRVEQTFTVSAVTDDHTVTATLAPDKPVTVLQPGDAGYVPTSAERAADAMTAPLKPEPAHALASALLTIHLGATAYATLDPTGRRAPVAHVIDRWHLYLFHGLDDEVPADASPQVIDTIHATATATKPHTH